MARIRKFRARTDVTDQYLRLGTDVEQHVRDDLTAQLAGPLRGPRGGRYEPIGVITFTGRWLNIDGYIRGLWTFGASRSGRYVRPHATPPTR